MRTKPLIGISCARQEDGAVFLRKEYAEAVAQAGGIPLLLPHLQDEYVKDQLSMLDGIIFSGGADYDPSRFGQTPHSAFNPMCGERERHDFQLFAAARERKIPILGICAGSQLAAIFFGAAIIQDIPDSISDCLNHHTGFDQLSHALTIAESSQLRCIMRTVHPVVNSVHHQSVDPNNLPDGLLVSACTDDGVVEAFKIIPGSMLDNGAWFAAIQWHPEHLYQDADQLAIFETLCLHASRKK